MKTFEKDFVEYCKIISIVRKKKLPHYFLDRKKYLVVQNREEIINYKNVDK